LQQCSVFIVSTTLNDFNCCFNIIRYIYETNLKVPVPNKAFARIIRIQSCAVGFRAPDACAVARIIFSHFRESRKLDLRRKIHNRNLLRILFIRFEPCAVDFCATGACAGGGNIGNSSRKIPTKLIYRLKSTISSPFSDLKLKWLYGRRFLRDCLIFQEVQFPFLVLLISGGHCILAVAEAVDKFLMLGQTISNAPGELLDKVI